MLFRFCSKMMPSLASLVLSHTPIDLNLIRHVPLLSYKVVKELNGTYCIYAFSGHFTEAPNFPLLSKGKSKPTNTVCILFSE